ncbi:MAG: DUF1343 domain-containing protein [Proteobacteria bacterium]|nr:DUF1343 domain-containing protein [Pseudomonadota bacterium]MBU1741808.1 DUF1343 domain-containing protein [Pseudomonadota bacterium]
MARTVAGLEILVSDPLPAVQKARLGLLTHQPAVDAELRPSWEVVARAFPGQLRALFGPQHGFGGDKQDNMVESDHDRDSALGVPVFSLYGQTRAPLPEMLDHIDVLLVDLVDVGTRVYTYGATLSLALEACGRADVPVIVLDRPNPIGGRLVEGNPLADDCTSFVGRHPIPQRHGLTLGEMARMIVNAFGVAAELTVVPLANWQRGQWFDQTGRPWVMPSPNMPTLDTAVVYPGQVLWEGTNLSEGRGTTRPFELFGAPFVDPQALARRFEARGLPGVRFRPAAFEPTFNKWAGKLCRGGQLHVTDREAFRPVKTSLALLQDVAALWPGHFRPSDPPYEYEYDRRPLDLIVGSTRVVDQVLARGDLDVIEVAWQTDLTDYLDLKDAYGLYPD